MKALLVPLALWVATPAYAEKAEPVTDKASAAVAGQYYLQGAMETASEMLLRPDGSFEWYLSAGAMDAFAKGSWRREGKQVILNADPADPAKAIITEGPRIAWEIGSELSLRGALNQKSIEAAEQKCPFLDNSVAYELARDEEELTITSLEEALQSLEKTRPSVEKAMAEAAVALDDRDLRNAAIAARAKWIEAETVYVRASWNQDIQPVDQPQPTVPAICGLIKLPADPYMDESEWLRGVAVSVGDEKIGMTLSPPDLHAIFENGDEIPAVAKGSGYTFITKRNGQKIVGFKLTAKWLPGGRTIPIAPIEEGTLALNIDSMLLIEPPFTEIILNISSKGLTQADGGSGIYKRR
jgi:hypothetical protein